MRFRLEIELDNDAMQTTGDIAAALQRLSRWMTLGGSSNLILQSATGSILQDRNGNTVGKWEVIETAIEGRAVTAEELEEERSLLSPEERAVLDALPKGPTA